MKNKTILIVLIIAAAALIRLYNIDGALFDINPLRQAVNAAISRNYAYNPQSQFLLPQMDNMGSSPGYFMFELPILPYVTSFLIKAFGIHNWVFRIVSVILFIFSSVYFYRLCSRLLDFRTCAVSLIFYCLAPMSIMMNRAFQSETFMLFVLFFSLYYFIRWLEEEKMLHLIYYTAGFTLLVLLKITNLYIFILAAALFLIYKKWHLMPRLIAPGLFISAVNFFWWIVYSSGIRELFPNEYTVSDKNIQVFTIPHIINVMREFSFSAAYWIMTLKHCAWIVLSPVLFALFLLGIFVKKNNKAQAALLAWLVSVIAFLFIVPSAATQEYYKIHLVPVAAIFAAFAYLWAFDRIKAVGLRRAAITIFWLVFTVNVFIVAYPVIRYKPLFEKEEELGKKVENISKKNDLILASFGPDAMLLFYCNRKGWSFYLDDTRFNKIDGLEQMRREGAKYYVCGNLDELDRNPGLKNYLFRKYRLISREDRVYGQPVKFSPDYFIWAVIRNSRMPFLIDLKNKLECKSLGYVIFDLEKQG